MKTKCYTVFRNWKGEAFVTTQYEHHGSATLFTMGYALQYLCNGVPGELMVLNGQLRVPPECGRLYKMLSAVKVRAPITVKHCAVKPLLFHLIIFTL